MPFDRLIDTGGGGFQGSSSATSGGSPTLGGFGSKTFNLGGGVGTFGLVGAGLVGFVVGIAVAALIWK